MAKITDNALLILEYMIKNDVFLGNDKKYQEVADALPLSEKEFNDADTYLLQKKLIDGAGSAKYGSRWVTPYGIDYFDRHSLTNVTESPNSKYLLTIEPPDLASAIQNLKSQYETTKTGFIMMQFGHSRAHEEITEAIRQTLKNNGLIGLRADDKEYHPDLFQNVQTYMYSCGFGIAVLESIADEIFNPNVSLEIGYMFALGKPVCLLKDKNLPNLPADLTGKLYRPFDPGNISSSIDEALTKWLTDKGLVQTKKTEDD